MPARLLQFVILWGTIQLEEVTNHQFLGFRLDVANRTVTCMQPDKVWCIRNPRSAGSWSSRASGFFYPAKPSSCNMHGHPTKDKGRFSNSGNRTDPKDSRTKCCPEHTQNSDACFDPSVVAMCSVRASMLWQLRVTIQLQSLAQASFDIRQCQISSDHHLL